MAPCPSSPVSQNVTMCEDSVFKVVFELFKQTKKVIEMGHNLVGFPGRRVV